MRRIKNIQIDDREITVKELRVREIIEAFSGIDKSSGLMDTVSSLLPKCTNLTVEDLTGMAPSEIASIYDAFREVNAVFFEAALGMGLSEVITSLKDAIRREFSAVLAASFTQGMQELSPTVTPSSL